jgi:arsenite oxidase small subunit
MKGGNRPVELGRRQFLGGGAAAAVAAGAMPRSAAATPALARITYPSTKLVNVKDLKIDQPVQIAIPTKTRPE